MNDTLETVSDTAAAEFEELFTVAMDIGEQMLKVGAEVNRVEDTLSRILSAYGTDDVEVFSITSLVIATVRTPDGRVLTQSRRATTHSTDLSRLEDYNALSRHICETRPAAAEIRARADAIRDSGEHGLPRDIFGYILAAGGFALFFGGTWIDGIAAALIGLLILLLDKFVKPPSANVLIYTFLCSAAAGTAAALTLKAGIPINPDKVMIGDIMVLIPGMAITNSIRDMFCGDIMTGLLRLAESVLVAAAIAVGFAIPVFVFGI